MTAAISRDPLRITIDLPGDGPKTFDLDGLPNHRLALDLLVALPGMLHPHGTVGRIGTAGFYIEALRKTVTDLAAEGFDGGAADLRRSQLAQLLMRLPERYETRLRRMMRSEAVRPQLRSDVVKLVSGRNFHLQPRSKPLRPYTPGEWQRLLDACRSDIRSAWSENRRLTAAAAAAGDPDQFGWNEGTCAWLLQRLGPLSGRKVAKHLGWTQDQLGAWGHSAPVKRALFLTQRTVTAYRVLFGAYTGIVADGIDGAQVGDLTWTGDATCVLEYVKGRTTTESLNLSPRAGRLLRQWLEHSALLRSFAPAPARDDFWLNVFNGRIQRPRFDAGRMAYWVAHHGLVDDTGNPLALQGRRLRTTYEAQRQGRGWSGRSTIDPNHSPQVEGDHYLAAATPAQRESVETLIVEAQHDLLRRAEAPIVVDHDEAAEAAIALPQEAARLGLAAGPLEELLRGEQDVFTAACADQFAGLHGPKGQPCPARPWVCLLCPLAVFAPRHLPNLLRLRAFFARQFQQMPSDQFAAVFAVYADRLSSQILPRFGEAALAEAEAQVDSDDATMPLRAEELTEGTTA